jgi:hypothetical protein
MLPIQRRLPLRQYTASALKERDDLNHRMLLTETQSRSARDEDSGFAAPRFSVW